MSRHAGYRRGFWEHVDNGMIQITTRRNKIRLKICNGIIVRQTCHEKEQTQTLEYGQSYVIRRNKRAVQEEFYEPDSIHAIRRGSLWKRQTDLQFCGMKGILECYSTSSGAYGKEVFTYDNGVQAYLATRWRKKLEVRRPDKRLWMIFEGKISLSRYPIVMQLKTEPDKYNPWRLVHSSSWAITVFDKDGKTILTQGRHENRQKQGKWIEQGQQEYYLSGIKVSRELLEDDPSQWNAYEILKIPNAQLRCSLMTRMGYDKLLEKIKYKTVDSVNDQEQLIEVQSKVNERSDGWPDAVIRLLRVRCPSTGQLYVLRVPPAIGTFEQARQWTFGLREQSIQAGTQFQLVRET